MNSIKPDIMKIYNALADAESRYIFGNRLLFSLTSDEGYIENIIKTTIEGKEFYNKLEQINTSKVIFGAGFWGRSIARQYSKYGFDCFVDNKARYPYEKKEGLPVISFDEYLKKYGNHAIIFLGSRIYYNELFEQLISHGIPEKRIVNVGKMIDDMSIRQYFDLPNMPCTDEEVFVDAGGYDGKTSKLFIQWCRNRYKKIYVFEPEEKNIIQCERNLIAEKAKFEVIPYGLWDKKYRLNFVENSNGTSHIAEEILADEPESTYIPVDSLDHLINDNITFIKMDIEGAEYAAIKGAEKTIKRCRPKLAISIYHNDNDIWELPKLIMDIRPDYRLYLRHYSVAQAETVLYAI
ncbi:MAG: FkbM family methyltransferase [Clostridiales bacterium]|nr:FkbM family methyltransferase [Clostridiales bacterium]